MNNNISRKRTARRRVSQRKTRVKTRINRARSYHMREGGNLVQRPNARFPGDIKQLPIQTRVIRYITGSQQVDQGITPRMLLRQLVSVTSAQTAAVAIIGSVKLKRVSMYFVPSTNDFDTSANVVSLNWTGILNSPETLITDRGTATVPACIKVVPPPNSQAGFWFDPNSTGFTSDLFVINCPANTVIDIEFDYVIVDGAAHTGTLTAAASLTGVIIATMVNATDLVPDGGVATGIWT